MIKKILIMLSLMVFSASMGYALDNPHDYTFPFACAECHTTDADPDWWDESNNVCLSCHTTSGAGIPEQTHSSENTSSKYGAWSQKCIDCHNPHYQKQLRIYTTSSYMYTGVSTAVSTTTLTQTGAGWEINQWAGNILLPDVSAGMPLYNFQYRIAGNTEDTIILAAKDIISTQYIKPNKSFAIIYGKLIKENLNLGTKMPVRFFRSAGLNSFAGGTARDGICEVCHTKAVYHKNNGTGLPHNPLTKCTECHEHKFGFKAVCAGCHDNPPGALVEDIRPDLATGSAESGVHDTHVKTHKILCEACHFDSVGTTDSTHNSGDHKITMGFNPFNGTFAGGTYDGQLSASYNTTTTSPPTSVTNSGMKQCSNIYCHGATMDPNGGTDTTPIWDDPSTGVCNSCHGASAEHPPIMGSHSKHAGTSGVQAPLECDVCHLGYMHVDTKIEWEFGPDERTAAAKYKGTTTGSDTMGSFSYGNCTELYCHSNAAPAVNVATSDPAFTIKNEANVFKTVTWGDTTSMQCDSCHRGLLTDTNTMQSNGHYRLVGPDSGRKYPCKYCHADTMDYVAGQNVISESGKAKHANGVKDVKMSTEWEMVNMPPPSYNADDLTCDNLYCHSDGTKEGTVNGVTVKPQVRAFPWNIGQTKCESCHGHEPGTCSNAGCHDGKLHSSDGKYWAYVTGWQEGEEWKGAVPMFKNGGPGTDRANSHQRHMEKDFTCDSCHNNTVINTGENCEDCHTGVETGDMGQLSHLRPQYHVNKTKDVNFNTGSNPIYHESLGGGHEAKSCENTSCHPGQEPVWGGSSFIACEGCHGRSTAGGGDLDDFNWGDENKNPYCGGTQALINTDEWRSSGHGRRAVDGPYPISGNPPADFEAKGSNPCAFCHDSEVLHNEPSNPFRLRLQQQFADRFDKECVYCHMQRISDSRECIDCHVRKIDGTYESIAPEATENGILFKQPNGYWIEKYPEHGYTTNCMGQDPVIANCHDSDIGAFDVSVSPTGAHKGHNEIPDGGEWTETLQNDVRTQYNMMGVCLKCHEEDSHDECNNCHEAPADNPLKYITGFDPDGDGPSFQRIRPEKAKATSVHYGYKHYQQGTNKGGKYCWDCHDPHGDSNIFMIQDKVATKSDGLYGVPVVKMYADGITSLPVVTSTCASDVGGTVVDHRRPVVFTDNAKGADSKTNDPGVYYARTKAWKEATGFPDREYDGICNVCHALKAAGISQHFGADYGESAHHSSQKCTQCHEHRFTSSHAAGKACDSCHGNKPVPSHTAFGLPRDCTKCHEGTIYNRMNIMGQMRANSHHVQGVATNNKHCYACHWEATEDGLINISTLPGTTRIAHEGYNFKTHITVPNAAADLVIWGQTTTRPTTYEAGTTGTTFTATSIGTPTERQNVSNVSRHCLSCHSTAQNDTQPFAEYGNCSNASYYSKETCNEAGHTWTADCKTPRQYAWDGTSIDERYSNKGTTTWGKYTSVTSASQKNITKAYSAHGNATANQGGGFNTTTGEDGALTNTRAGSQNVQCFDCHSSHGSAVEGITSSYVSFSGNKNGGNLKETQENRGGYSMTYKASKNEVPGVINPYNPGAGQCFDCHEVQTAGTRPWGYQSTFGATSPVIGYRDSARFGQALSGKNARYPYPTKPTTKVGGHLKASSSLTTAVSGSINGLCSPCHDPHGVSRTLGAGMKYAVPLLKGTWMTSPFKEDVAPDNKTYRADSYTDNTDRNLVVRPGYNIDQNSLMNDRTPTQSTSGGVVGGVGIVNIGTAAWNWSDLTKVSENIDMFAGLCLKCHPKSSLDPDTGTAWKSMDRIHETVKGWGGQGKNAGNEIHAYTCSKCHSPHVSDLPRLMVTNCLDYKHKGKVASGGSPYWGNYSYYNASSQWGKGGGQFPSGGAGFGNGGWSNWPTLGVKIPIGFGGGGYDNRITCHDTAPGNGGATLPLKQLWNTKTPW